MVTARQRIRVQHAEHVLDRLRRETAPREELPGRARVAGRACEARPRARAPESARRRPPARRRAKPLAGEPRGDRGVAPAALRKRASAAAGRPGVVDRARGRQRRDGALGRLCLSRRAPRGARGGVGSRRRGAPPSARRRRAPPTAGARDEAPAGAGGRARRLRASPQRRTTSSGTTRQRLPSTSSSTRPARARRTAVSLGGLSPTTRPA